MINSIFAFDDKLAYEIMTPRTDVFLIDIEDSPEEYLDELMKLRYSGYRCAEGITTTSSAYPHKGLSYKGQREQPRM